jgi:hypothetical protein
VIQVTTKAPVHTFYCSTIYNSQAKETAKMLEFYSATKKNEILSFPSKWLDLENIILNEVGQAEKAKNHMFSLICGL